MSAGHLVSDSLTLHYTSSFLVAIQVKICMHASSFAQECIRSRARVIARFLRHYTSVGYPPMSVISEQTRQDNDYTLGSNVPLMEQPSRHRESLKHSMVVEAVVPRTDCVATVTGEQRFIEDSRDLICKHRMKMCAACSRSSQFDTRYHSMHRSIVAHFCTVYSSSAHVYIHA